MAENEMSDSCGGAIGATKTDGEMPRRRQPRWVARAFDLALLSHDFAAIRRILKSAWTETHVLDEIALKARIKGAKALCAQTEILQESRSEDEAVYRIRSCGQMATVYLDFIGRRSHYCTCPSGTERVVTANSNGSLCEHVVACLIMDPNSHELLPMIAVAAGRRFDGSRHRSWLASR